MRSQEDHRPVRQTDHKKVHFGFVRRDDHRSEDDVDEEGEEQHDRLAGRLHRLVLFGLVVQRCVVHLIVRVR